MNNLAILNQTAQTMSSREIAHLCEKQHGHVCRDIENLNQTYEQMGLSKVGEGYYTHPSTGSQQHREFLLTKEQSIDLVTGYRADIRIRINRRWQELESQQQVKIPQTLPEALRLAADLAEQNTVLAIENAELRPKAEARDHATNVYTQRYYPHCQNAQIKRGGVMNIYYIQHNFADWDSQTKHMTRIEKSIFLDLRTMYFGNAKKSNGNVDGNDFELLCYRLSCKTEEEITALKLLLKDQFTKVGNFYVNDEWDQQILAILGNHKRVPWNEWKVTRQRIFERDGFTCTYCGSTATNLECDHIQPISRGGSNDDYNLTTACTSCNRKKHNKLLGEWS